MSNETINLVPIIHEKYANNTLQILCGIAALKKLRKGNNIRKIISILKSKSITIEDIDSAAQSVIQDDMNNHYLILHGIDVQTFFIGYNYVRFLLNK